ncbi:hypothetical protein SDRG_09641 [Saprolegnia diclina VS20]|uniref:Uncharacterized protein n=1 Tax=Saprolegnia diclina (strain VS20) TaxID=1156394 RepID=T0QGB1_SAPDV|nr:hypothetical protein SDRG_09641 [Saprolegnia diclina VS20]EQC32665.1 hypothetical protein SDRG_09641 [Saprolegnia diclina VS20]|eukprot:XP_008613809.1 hypothetical protein SDRG_09641 [Saprolegnia diclina VS20]
MSSSPPSTTAVQTQTPAKVVDCDVCLGFTIYTSAMRDAKEDPKCIGVLRTKSARIEGEFAEVGGKDDGRQKRLVVDQHVKAFVAGLAEQPHPPYNKSFRDLIYIPATGSFRFTFVGVTLYSKKTLSENNMVLPICLGYSRLKVTRDEAPVSDAAPAVSRTHAALSTPTAPGPSVLDKLQAACSFTAVAMWKYGHRTADGFGERYIQSMERLVGNMHKQVDYMAKMTHRIVTFGGSRKSSE